MEYENLRRIDFMFKINDLKVFLRFFMMADRASNLVVEQLVQLPGCGAESLADCLGREPCEVAEGLESRAAGRVGGVRFSRPKSSEQGERQRVELIRGDGLGGCGWSAIVRLGSLEVESEGCFVGQAGEAGELGVVGEGGVDRGAEWQ
jgi:hypothetical protein